MHHYFSLRWIILVLLAFFLWMPCKDAHAIEKSKASLLTQVQIKYSKDKIEVQNRCLSQISINTGNAPTDIVISASNTTKLIVNVSGKCNNGSLTIKTDSCCVINLKRLNLHSSKGPVIKVSSPETHIIVSGMNHLSDGLQDSIQMPSSCIEIDGRAIISGKGKLEVCGNRKYAIYSSGDIVFEGANISIPSAKSDAIHVFGNTMFSRSHLYINNVGNDGVDSEGNVTIDKSVMQLSISGNGRKGIKSGKNIYVQDSRINSLSTGDVSLNDGAINIPSIMRSGEHMFIRNSHMYLTNKGNGGMCLSAGQNLYIKNGDYRFETHGDGSAYIKKSGKMDYYTSKCIYSGDSLTIKCGKIKCLSTGKGGKGIESRGCSLWGEKNANPFLSIDVETIGTSIVNDTITDKRFGCPKAIKTGSTCYVFSGRFNIKTHGMGGEGFEAETMKVSGGNITCETFDDGINVEKSLIVNDGNIYCNSVSNDGIDSNGKITIRGGNILSVSQHNRDESFDSEKSSLYIYGGTIIGLSYSTVDMGLSSQPVHNDELFVDPYFPIRKGKYRILDARSHTIFSFDSPFESDYCHLIISSPLFQEETYTIINAKHNIIKTIKPKRHEKSN